MVSQSDGALAIWRPHPNGGAPVQEVAPWHAHTLRGGMPTEAWITFFKSPGRAGEGKASLVVSGADDALMKGWDLRVGGGTGFASPAFVCKDHGAGVTAGQWHPSLEHIFVRCVMTVLCTAAIFDKLCLGLEHLVAYVRTPGSSLRWSRACRVLHQRWSCAGRQALYSLGPTFPAY